MPTRKHPIHGIELPSVDQTLIIFLTVCTKDRNPWLASEEAHQQLLHIWKRAEAWLIGCYVVMPDHIHLFAAPGRIDLPLENWIRFWKSQFSKVHQVPEHRWQVDHWDTRLRSWQSYEDKWNYVRANPVRHGLVDRTEDWPYQGELNELRWD